MTSLARSSALRLPLVAVACLVPACGSRSALPEDSAGEGAGACAALSYDEDFQTGDLVTPIEASYPNYLDVRLTPSSDDGTRLTAILTRQWSGGSIVSHATLSPWKEWPNNGLLPSVKITAIHTNGTAIGAPAKGDRFSIFAPGFLSKTGGLVLYPDLDPGESGQGSSTAAVSVPGESATFLLPPQETDAGTPKVKYLSGGFLSPMQSATPIFEDGSAPYTEQLGCATNNQSAAAGVAYRKEWLIAVSSGDSNPPGCTGDTVGPPDRIDIVVASAYGGTTLATSIAALGVTQVRAAPHEDGMYVVWTQSHPGPDTVQVARYDGPQNQIVGPVNLAEEGETNLGVATARVGASLLVVRGRAGGIDGIDIDHMVFTLLDEDLNRLWEWTLVPTYKYVGPLDLWGSPEGKGAVLAWIDQADGISLGRLSRLDCVE
ncbi:MAG: hypothetical protein U0441_23795 [Polyangiaceae bacterium]